MALKNIRVNVNETVNLNDAFMGRNLSERFVKGEFTSIIVDGRGVEFKQTYDAKAPIVEEKVEDGVWYHQERLRATASGLYGETIVFRVIYSTFKDRVYKRVRPERACFKMLVENLDQLKYPPQELYAMVAGTFSDN